MGLIADELALADTSKSVGGTGLMNKEAFGVFGDEAALKKHRDRGAFDEVVQGGSFTVGIRDPALGQPGRSLTFETADGICVIWGEVYPVPGVDTPDDLGRWFLDRFRSVGRAAFTELNGSYLAIVSVGDRAVVATDPVRSWECFYTDTVGGDRVFGTDAAAVAGAIDSLAVDDRTLLEFLLLGTIVGDRTLLRDLHRVPFDGYLTRSDVDEFDRFVYAPAEFDYATALARRLERAIDRRAHYPNTKGVLLSAGYDSRTILPRLAGDRHCFTVGAEDSPEVAVAKRIADQYGADHTALPPGASYLLPDDEKIRHTQGIKESLHIHHAGYDDRLEGGSMYHGLLYDTLFKGYFLERAGIKLFGKQLPTVDLAADPAPIEDLLDTLGFIPTASHRLDACLATTWIDIEVPDPHEFIRRRLQAEFKRCWDRTDSVHNAMDLLVVRNQPTLPFHTHIADQYVEGFVAVDVELLDWHLRTPPSHRNQQTFLEAVTAFDDDILTHRPPDQPYHSHAMNQIERFVRRKIPLAKSFKPSWPDRRAVYERHNLDDRLFPGMECVHALPVRQKLRLNDIHRWLSLI